MAEESTESLTTRPTPHRRLKISRLIARLFLLAWLLTGLWHAFKPLPEGTHVRGAVVDTPLADVQLLSDLTTADAFGAPLIRQQIFDEVIALIGRAREYLVLDFFLFNAQRG